ncbi:MAG: MoxR family ATPase [Candidatus Heimdallarchaeota archaeon]|nr:MoxR family ATPase [Candidatus Heimdallarchaeota archaeon]MCG3256479.1 MoxR family ATPase [Candidatus Heimdallarchaeota archaeon]MCK4611544.1 MoxR family ATPase [Candidatus Heimdallarchaeota archaeon]
MTQIQETKEIFSKIMDEMKKRIVGNENVIELMFASLLSGGNVLLEGVPGIAKTLMASTLAEVMKVGFKRIQFTSDLMPADITGGNIYERETSSFKFIEGPVFTNILLTDEINRSPPKTQSALLEAMQEKQVSSGKKTYKLPEPFMVIATQNPIESTGVYPLPEAQIDRFLVKIPVYPPSLQGEISMLLKKKEEMFADVNAVTKKDTLQKLSNEIESSVILSNQIIEYIAKLVVATRSVPSLALGASPRGSIALLTLSRSIAAIRGRDFVEPDDIKSIFFPVMNHRLILSPEAEIEQIRVSEIIQNILTEVEVVI